MSNLKKLVLSVSFALYLSAGVVHATVYNVTNTTDGPGLNQLRGALWQAGQTAGTHTVNISAGTYYVDYDLIMIGTASNVTVTIQGAGIGSTIIDARQRSRAFVIDPASSHVNVKVNFSGLTVQNCKSTSTTGGGAVLALGREGSAYSFDNCEFLNNTATNATSVASGGAIMCAVSSLSITNCIFINNISETGNAGAVFVDFYAGLRGILSGSATISNSLFSSNSALAEYARGGAILVALDGASGGFSTSMTKNTFVSNSAPYGSAGGVAVNGYLDNSPVNLNYNRFYGNTGSPEFSDRSAVYIFGLQSPLDGKNNWWGCNDGATGCADRGVCGVESAGDIFSPYLQLKTTLDAPSICYPGTNSVQVTAGFTSNSANEPIAAANLDALVGRPVLITASGGIGAISGTQSTIQATGTATRTFTPNGTPGIENFYSLCDGTPSGTVPLTVNVPGSWLGTSNTSWDLPANWCGGAVPTASTNVNIPAGTPHAPTIGSSTNAVANNLTIATGATLTQAAFAVMHVKGIFTNNGTFNANTSGAITAFSGAVAQTIPGGDYATLAVDGGVNKTLGADVTAHDGFLFTGNTKLLLGDNTLTLESGARFTGHNASNYIATNGTGSVRKKGLGALGFTFPIGLETSYSPVVVSNDGTMDHFTARVGNGVYLSYLNDVPQGSAISEKGVNRTWYISEDTPGGSNAIMTVGWTATDELTSFVRSNCFISHYENNKWDVAAGTAAIETSTYYQSRTGITSFSPFAVTNPDSPLPVTLARFDAVKEGLTALLSWSTTEETNSDRFEVERSINGKIWQKIGTVRANGESKVWVDYRFTDEQPVSSHENLYRLKMVDRATSPGDGAFAYSRIRSLKFDGDNDPVVFPNPVNDKLFVQDFTRVSGVRITDVSGKAVYQSTTMRNDGISVKKLAAGVHFVEIMWLNGRKTVRKIVINP